MTALRVLFRLCAVDRRARRGWLVGALALGLAACAAGEPGTTAQKDDALSGATAWGPVFAEPEPTEPVMEQPAPVGGTGGTGAAGGTGGTGGIAAGGTGGTGGIATAGSGGGMPVDTTPDAGTMPPVNPNDSFDDLRNACVAHINMYRATLGLDPLMRASAAQETCSDMGAKSDSVNGAHKSAGSCQGLGSQNSCPRWPAPGGNVPGAMEQCLDSMWAEGEPPVPVPQCINDYANCFLKHGHYINMSDSNSRVVSCGFFKMPDGSWWMNQDFGY